MTTQRFRCTSCGQCCYGWLPLTLADALAHADRFPLAVLWTPVRQGGKAFDLTAQLGAQIQLANRKRVAVSATPIAYIPPSIACPALSSANLCAIQDTKPLRCRAMPFDASRDEQDQTSLLVPRKEWACDTAQTAPIVYCNKEIVTRADFDAERVALLAQAPQVRHYITQTLKYNQAVVHQLAQTALAPLGGRFVVNFSPLLRLNGGYDLAAFAQKQTTVLMAFAERTAQEPSLASYTTYYKNAITELAPFARQDNAESSLARSVAESPEI